MEYCHTHKAEDKFSEEIAKMVARLKRQEEFILEYLILSMHDQDNLREGYEEGVAKGIEQGIEQGSLKKALETARNALKMNLSHEQISQLTGLSLQQIQ